MILKGVGKMSESKTSVAPANSSGSKKQTAKMLGFGGFFAMTASMVMTVYAYPNFASSGLHLIFFLILGGVFWFLPVALVAAEMATVKGWENGGIFAWVGNTLGKRWGFSALFYQWFQITVGFVTMAFFVLAAISYIVGWDALYNNPLVMFIGVAIIVWGLTLTQLGGTKLTARIAKVGFFGGVLIPAVVLLIGLIAYLAVTCQRIVTRADLSMTMADKFLKDMKAEIANLDNATVIGAQDSNIAPKKSFDHSGR